PAGAVRVDANGRWDVDTAVAAIRELDRAAGGLEYVEQPCHDVEQLAAVRRRVDVRIAADESIRRAEDPLRVAVAGAADVAVLKVAPLGGVRRALAVAEACGLPCVVSSALETSVGLAAELALAGALPELGFACGLGTRSLLCADVVDPADELVPRDGRLPVPRRAPEPVRRADVAADPQRAAWWRARLQRVSRLPDPR
ncbi:MAG TPA: enolase C-terminal domain-like protein, partial [Pseudonocardia sp.]|nr:enolase C-terminal domain-like protein [Pseudonocardia sp.]